MWIEPDVITEENFISRDTSDGSPAELPIFVAKPQNLDTPRPALLLIQEAFGVNDHIREVCRRFARKGYIVVSPDLYYRIGKWKSFPYTDFEATVKARESMQEEPVITDLATTLNYISDQKDVKASCIGAVGYCLGGLLTYVTAVKFPNQIKAAAVYYGGGIVQNQDNPHPIIKHPPVEETSRIQAQLVGFFGGQDKGIPYESVEKIDQSLKASGVTHKINFYPDAEHGFYCDERASFHPRAAQDAWNKTINLFDKILQPNA